MYASALNATLKLLFFRAGPEDFPYEPRLSAVLLPLAVLANFLLFYLMLPAGLALVVAVAMVGALALATRALLRMRGLEARYTQTYHALLATGAVLTLALVPPFSQVAPQWLALMEHPEKLGEGASLDVPVGVALAINVLSYWNLAVSAFIYRNAAQVNIGFGLVIALAITLLVLVFVVFFASMAGALLGLAPNAGV